MKSPLQKNTEIIDNIKSLQEEFNKFYRDWYVENRKRWSSYNIELSGSHSDHVWVQALNHLENIICDESIKTLADIGCGYPFLDLQKAPEFSNIENIIRVDGSSQVLENCPDVLQCNFNKEKLPIEDSFVDFAISFEVIEHLYSTFDYLSELNRISKKGFLISKPNTDFNGLKSKWYGEKYFFSTEIPLFDGDKRFEHINFIPNYELFKFGEFLNCSVTLLDTPQEEIQFFLFEKR